MYERKIPLNTDCGTVITMLVLGGKWKPWLISHIHMGTRRPSELQREIGVATRRVLTQQLLELEQNNIVRKVVYAETPPRVEYFLTPLGESLLPIIDRMNAWGEEHREELIDKI